MGHRLQAPAGPGRQEGHDQIDSHQIRIATLSVIRDGACRRRKGMPVTHTSAAAHLLHLIRAAIHRDWRRVQASGPEELTAGICCSSWLRGRHPFISLQQFRGTWAHQGVLCSLGQEGNLTVHISLISPEPFAGGGEGGGPTAGLVSV